MFRQLAVHIILCGPPTMTPN